VATEHTEHFPDEKGGTLFTGRAIVHKWKQVDPEFIRASKYVRRRIEQPLFEMLRTWASGAAPRC
jgi:hypothetical protein